MRRILKVIGKLRLIFLLAVFLLPSGYAARASQQNNQVFEIGKFDRSSTEFSSASPAAPVDYVVGTSSASRDWYAEQPAVLSTSRGTATLAAQPRQITFTLTSTRAPAYTLRVALLIERASVPVIRIGINGKYGLFYLHPKLDLSAGDIYDVFDAIYSRADVVFEFPGNYLRNGTNVISLQAVEPAAEEAADAGIHYDAISLSQASAPEGSKETGNEGVSPLIVPTVFYQQKQGRLTELIDVFLRFEGRPRPGSKVDLTIDGKRYQKTITGTEDFGEGRFEFAIPEFKPDSTAQLSWTSAGRPRHVKKAISPAKKWTLFLVPHIHLDVGYSDYQAKVAAIQSRTLNEAMDFTVKHPEFRFSTDGEWNLEQFLKTRTPAEKQRLIQSIQKEQIFIPAQYANLLTGFSTAETLIRSLYPSANFSRLHNTPFNYANITDVPSYSWSYASILASAGIKDFIAASDNYRAPVLLQGRLQYKSPMWWVGPDGKKVLFWYSRHYMAMTFLFGLPPVTAAGRETVPLFLQMYDEPSYKAHATILFGSQVENTDLYPQQAALAGKWNAVYTYPHMEYSGFHHALETIAQQFGGDLPTIRGGGGPYWEDGIASDSLYASMERANESRGPSAEKLETITSLVTPCVAADTQGLHRMWKNMVLMDEHTFDSHNSIAQPRSQMAIQQLKVKDSYAVHAHDLADWLSRNSMASISNSISAGPGSLIVFNTLNWRRSGMVSVDLPDGDEIVDQTTGETVPCATVFQGNGFRRVRFIAESVLPVGYKVYSIRKAAHLQPKPTASTSTSSTTMESPYYRVVLDPATGAVKSIYDKQLHRELVNTSSPYRFGQYLYVTGGDNASKSVMGYRMYSPLQDLAIHPAHDGTLVSVTHTPYGWVAKMKSSDINTPEITAEIRLFNGEKKIELIEQVDKHYTTRKEAVYLAFPFAMSHPEFQYEIQSGVVNPAKDLYPGAGLVWFSTQHWVSAEQDGISGTVMPLDAALVTLGDINRGTYPSTFGSRPGTIFSYVMNNYWNTNYAAGQGGHFRFRYVITSASKTDPARLSRLGWEEMTPLEATEVTSQDKAVDSPQPLSGKQSSFLIVDDPDVVLDTWKPAEDGKGTVLRFIDLGGKDRTITVHTPLLRISQAWLADAVERNQKQLPLAGSNGFSFPISPHEIVTVRLLGTPTNGHAEN